MPLTREKIPVLDTGSKKTLDASFCWHDKTLESFPDDELQLGTGHWRRTGRFRRAFLVRDGRFDIGQFITLTFAVFQGDTYLTAA